MTTADDAAPNSPGELSRRQWVRDVAIAGAVVAAGAGLAACTTSGPRPAGLPPGTRDGTPGAPGGGGAGTAPSGASGASGAAGHGPPPSRHSGEGAAPPQTPNDLAPEFVVAKASAIPVGGGKVYPKHGVVVTQPTAGRYKCFNASCTHLGCTVNKVTAGLILCPCHGAKFSIVDGSVKAGPALRPLTAEKFSITDGDIVLD